MTIMGHTEEPIEETANLFYRVNGGAWQQFTLAPIIFDELNYAVNSSVIYAQLGDSLEIAVQGLSNNDRNFGLGQNSGVYNTYFGKSSPYSYGVISGPIEIYVNLGLAVAVTSTTTTTTLSCNEWFGTATGSGTFNYYNCGTTSPIRTFTYTGGDVIDQCFGDVWNINQSHFEGIGLVNIGPCPPSTTTTTTTTV